MEATAGFEEEEEEVGNEAHVHDRKVILLFGMVVTPDSSAFCCPCNSEVSPLYLHKPHPRIKKLTFCLNEKLDVLRVQCLFTNSTFYQYEPHKKEKETHGQNKTNDS